MGTNIQVLIRSLSLLSVTGQWRLCFTRPRRSSEEVAFLNFFRHECYLEFRRPRLQNDHCGQVRAVQGGPWEVQTTGVTLLLQAFDLTLLREMSLNAFARIVSEYNTYHNCVWCLFQSYVIEAYNQADFSSVCILGSNGLSAWGGHDYLSAFSELETNRVLEPTKGKVAITWNHSTKEKLPQHWIQSNKIKCVSNNISAAYQKIANKKCPSYKVVFRRFYLIQIFGKALITVRRKEHQSQYRKGDTPFKESLWLFCNNTENLNPVQMSFNLQDIYKLNFALCFQRKLNQWCYRVQSYGKSLGYLFKPMLATAEGILSCFEGIISYAYFLITCAFIEVLNSVCLAVSTNRRLSIQ